MKTRATMFCAIAALSAIAGNAAAAITATSNAHGLSADVSLVGGLVGIDLGPLPSASGVAPSPYAVTQSTLSASASVVVVGSVNTALLTSNASSNVNFGASSGVAMADATVNDLNLELVPGALFLPDLLFLSADTITSSAQISRSGGLTTTTGTSTIENAVLSVSGVGFLSVAANPAPNTVLLNAAGIRIVLNEQVITTLGDTTSIQVNAIHISVNGALNTVDADVVVGHSAASMTVPTPGALALLGAAGTLATRRRRAV